MRPFPILVSILSSVSFCGGVEVSIVRGSGPVHIPIAVALGMVSVSGRSDASSAAASVKSYMLSRVEVVYLASHVSFVPCVRMAFFPALSNSISILDVSLFTVFLMDLSMFSMCSDLWCIRMAGMELMLSSLIASYPVAVVHVFVGHMCCLGVFLVGWYVGRRCPACAWYSVAMPSFASAISLISCDAVCSRGGDCSFIWSSFLFISLI